MTTNTPPYPTPTKPYKAVVTFLITFVGALYWSLQGRETLDSMSAAEWVLVIISALVVAGGAYITPNPPK